MKPNEISSQKLEYSIFLQRAKVYTLNNMLMTFASKCAILAAKLCESKIVIEIDESNEQEGTLTPMMLLFALDCS